MRSILLTITVSCNFSGLQRIHKHENAHIAYQKQLRSEGVVKKEQIDEIHDNISKILSAEFDQVGCLVSFPSSNSHDFIDSSSADDSSQRGML